METHTESSPVVGPIRQTEVVVNRVTLAQPWEWLVKGWGDVLKGGHYSLAYGAGIVAISVLITLSLASNGLGFLVPFLAAGFYLLAPVVAMGLYQMSAHLERGEPLKFCQFLEAWKRNQGQLGIVAAGLLIVMQLWVAANFILFALLYPGISPPLDRFFSTIFLSEEGRTFAVASLSVGFLLAWISYAISAISIPMLIDRPVDGWTAIKTSVKAVTRSWPAMTLWAVLIVLFAGLGILTMYVGLAVAMPLLGHATWHAYRDLVPRPDQPATLALSA